MNNPNQSPIDLAANKVKAVFSQWRRKTPIAEMRRDYDTLFYSDAIPAKEESIRIGSIPAQWVSTAESRPDQVLLLLHGGGYRLGSIRAYRDLAARLANATKCRVLVPEYRLAPENVFPAALEDALTVYRWLLTQGTPGSKLVVLGDSAGGGLTIATVVAAIGEGLPKPRAVVALSPWMDLDTRFESHQTLVQADPINQPAVLKAIGREYLHGASPDDPRASPVFSDFRGFPPLLVQIGGREILLDDAKELARRAKAAGVDAELEVYPTMTHVFHQLADTVIEGQQAIDAIGTFLERHP